MPATQNKLITPATCPATRAYGLGTIVATVAVLAALALSACTPPPRHTTLPIPVTAVNTLDCDTDSECDDLAQEMQDDLDGDDAEICNQY